MVLVRRLTHVRLLEEALEAASLRFTVEGGKSFFDRQEVGEILAVLKAVEDPTDRVSLVAALRSSFLGVSDRDIVAFALSGGDLRLCATPRAETTFDPDAPWATTVPRAMGVLEALHRDRTKASVPALIESFFDETRVLAALTGTRRGEGAIANLRKVVTLARAASDLGVLTLRGFTRLLQERTETAREEPDLPTTRAGDPDTVRILSVHKAKGLESPVVAVFDTADNFIAGSSVIPLFDEGTVAIGFRKGCQPPQWDALVKREEKRAWAEARRLLYVAATRARDLLVLPRAPGLGRVRHLLEGSLAGPAEPGDADVRVVDAATLPSPERDASRAQPAPAHPVGGRRRRGGALGSRAETLLEEASYRAYVPTKATALGGETFDRGQRARARAGLRGLRAQAARVDLLRGHGQGRGRAPGAGARAVLPPRRARGRPRRRARLPGARDADSRASARARRVWREIPLFFPEEGKLVEGIVDLVFEEDDGLVVADYKTEALAPGEEAVRADRHAPQFRAYHRGLRDALARVVKERFVVFTSTGRAVPV